MLRSSQLHRVCHHVLCSTTRRAGKARRGGPLNLLVSCEKRVFLSSHSKQLPPPIHVTSNVISFPTARVSKVVSAMNMDVNMDMDVKSNSINQSNIHNLNFNEKEQAQPQNIKHTNDQNNQSPFSQRKYELIQYIQNAILYEIQHILDINDDYTITTTSSDISNSSNTTSIRSIYSKNSKLLRPRFESKLYYSQQRLKNPSQQLKQNQQQRMLNLNNDNIYSDDQNDENEHVIMDIPSASSSPSSSSSSSTMSLLDLLESTSNSNNHNHHTNHTNHNNNGDGNTKNIKIQNLFDLLDDDDYGFDHDNDDDDDNNNNYYYESNDNLNDIRIDVHHEKENSLLSLLNDINFDDSMNIHANTNANNATAKESRGRGGSLLDLLDDNDFNNHHNSVATGSKSTTKVSPPPSSLLDLLNNDDNTNQTTKTNWNDTCDSSTKMDCPSLLDLLDDHNDDTNINNKNGAHTTFNYNNEIDKANDNIQSQGIPHDGMKRESLLSLLNFDDDNNDNIDQQQEERKNQSFMDKNDGTTSFMEESNNHNLDIGNTLLHTKSLLSIMDKKHWELYRQMIVSSKSTVEYDKNNDDTNTILNNVDVQEELIIDDALDDDIREVKATYTDMDDIVKEEETSHILSSLFVNELVDGTRTNKWQLTVDEYNLLLMFVATSNIEEKSERLLKIYLHMDELASAGVTTAAPNSDTYTILMTLFDRCENLSAVAAEIGSKMLQLGRVGNIEDDEYFSSHNQALEESNNDGIKEEVTEFQLDEVALNVAMRLFAKRLDLEKAQLLLQWTKRDNIPLSPSTCKVLFRLYKSCNEQDLALDLVRTCIEVRKMRVASME